LQVRTKFGAAVHRGPSRPHSYCFQETDFPTIEIVSRKRDKASVLLHGRLAIPARLASGIAMFSL
jgi:hypothetical protein